MKKSLKQYILEEIDAYPEDKIRDKVQSSLDKLLDRVIEDVLSPYGNKGKELKEIMEKELKISSSKLGIKGYNKKITEFLNQELRKVTHEDLHNKLSKIIKQATGDLPKDTYKFSEIIAMYRDQAKNDSEKPEGSIDIDFSYNVSERSKMVFYHITLSTKDGNEPDYRLFLFGKYEGDEIEMEPVVILESLSENSHKMFLDSANTRTGFGDFLFKLYVTDTKIIMDKHWESETDWYMD